MKAKFVKFIVLVGLSLVLFSCTHSNRVFVEGRSAYYWSTIFCLDKSERDFLEKNKIERLYVRFFDVVSTELGPMPNASIVFKDKIPSGLKVIPTVYIMNECMRNPDSTLAEKIFERLVKMCSSWNIVNVDELQIDCDWTTATKNNFMSFMDKFYGLVHQKGLRLSCTVRLSQLSCEVPKADRGVLMVYNTGDFTDLEKEKPILDLNDIKPYLSSLKDYDLELGVAFPLFKWDLLFTNKTFNKIVYNKDGLVLNKEDSFVRREATLDDIVKAKKILKQVRPDIDREIVVFDLGIYNVNKFTDEQYSKIFSR